MTSHSPLASLGRSITTETSSGKSRPRQKLRGVGRDGGGGSHPSACLVLLIGTSPWSPRSWPHPLCCCGGRRTPTSSRGWWGPSAGALCPAGWKPTFCQAWGTGSHRATLRKCTSTCGPSYKTCCTSGPCSLALVHLGDHNMYIHRCSLGSCMGVELLDTTQEHPWASWSTPTRILTGVSVYL